MTVCRAKTILQNWSYQLSLPVGPIRIAGRRVDAKGRTRSCVCPIRIKGLLAAVLRLSPRCAGSSPGKA